MMRFSLKVGEQSPSWLQELTGELSKTRGEVGDRWPRDFRTKQSIEKEGNPSLVEF